MKASAALEAHAKTLRGLGEFCTKQGITMAFRGVDHAGNLNLTIIPPKPLDTIDLNSISKKEDHE